MHVLWHLRELDIIAQGLMPQEGERNANEDSSPRGKTNNGGGGRCSSNAAALEGAQSELEACSTKPLPPKMSVGTLPPRGIPRVAPAPSNTTPGGTITRDKSASQL
jgi:hypothetical protein